MGLMGFAGGMSIQFVLPRMGAIFDSAKAEAAGGAEQLASLSPAAMEEVVRYASVESFQSVAVIPLLRFVIVAKSTAAEGPVSFPSAVGSISPVDDSTGSLTVCR